MPNPPLVSVVVPAYNYAHFLDDCLRSALDQTYPHVEVIVIDDGSDDDTAEVVRHYPSVRYFFQARNGNGGARAVNRGIREARGDYVAWLSADDRFVPEKIAKQVAALQAAQAEDPRVCMATSDVFYEARDAEGLAHCPLNPTEQQRQLSERGYVRWTGNIPEFPHDEQLARMLIGNFVNGCTTLIDRRMLDEIGLLDDAMPRSGDVELWSRMLALGKRFVFVPEPLTITRIHKTNTSAWGEIPAEYNLTRRKLLERTPLERFFPHIRYGDTTAIRQAHVTLGDAMFQARAFDAAAEQYALGSLACEDRRFVQARSSLPPMPDSGLVPLDIPGAKSKRLVMAFDEASDTARCHQAISHYLQAFAPEDDISLVVWIPQSADRALESFSERFSEVCTALGIDPEHDSHADVLVLTEPPGGDSNAFLHQLFAACGGFLPLGTALDSILFAAARRTNLVIAYEATIEGLQRISKLIDPRAIDIVLLTHNRLAYLERTLGAIFERTEHPFRLTIVDNASEPDVRAYLQRNQSRLHRVVYNHENGWTPAFAQGVAITRSNPFIVSDPDIIVPDLKPCWLTHLITLMEQHPELGMLALNLDPVNKPAKMPDVYISEKHPYGPDITLSSVGTVMQTIRREYFPTPYTTDFEAVVTIRQHGGLVGFANHVIGYHLGWDEERDYPEHLIKKFRYFNDTHHTDVYKLYTEDPELLSAMHGASKHMVSIVMPIVDVSAAMGCLQSIAAAQEQGLDFELILVEIGPRTSAHEELYSVLQGDIKVVQAGEQATLGAALNLGARETRSDTLVFLEPSVVVASGWSRALLSALDQAELASATLVDNEGKVSRGAFVFRHVGPELTPIPLYPGAWSDSFLLREVRGCQAAAGGAFAIMAETFNALGGFDSDLVGDALWLDLSLRVSYAGGRVVSVGEAKTRVSSPSSHSPWHVYRSNERFQMRWDGLIQDDAFQRYAADGLKLAGIRAANGACQGFVLVGPNLDRPLAVPCLQEPWLPSLLVDTGSDYRLPDTNGDLGWYIDVRSLDVGYDPHLRYNDEIDVEQPNNSPTYQLEFVGQAKRVLELGCSAGKMTKHLVARGCVVVGVELDPLAAKHAERFAERVIVGDIETLDVEREFGSDRFDVILTGDVLEHLRDPEAVLRKLRRLLRPGGVWVGSVPNVAHGSVRLALLAGQWRYRRVGLLDQTHIHLFTKASLEETLRRAGYRVDAMRPTISGIEGLDMPFPTDVLPPEVVSAVLADPEATHYQYVFRAVPTEMPCLGQASDDRSLQSVTDPRALAHASGGRPVPKVLVPIYSLEACQLLRLVYPLKEAAKQGLVEYRLVNVFAEGLESEAMLAEIRWADVIVFQRYAFPEHLELLWLCKSFDKRTVFEIDDDLLNVPFTNHNHTFFRQPVIHQTLETFLSEVDLVTVTTKTLASAYAYLNPNIEVLPNALPEEAFPCSAPIDIQRIQSSDRLVVGYAGTATHIADLQQVVPALLRLLAENPKLSLVFIGCMPNELADHPAVTFIPATANYEEFASTLRNCGIQIGIAPLVDDDFNAAKSAIKWQEYAASGIVSVCSAVGPYKEAVTDGVNGVLVSDGTSQAWYQAITRLLRDEDLRIRLADQAYQTIRARHTVSVNAHRWAQTYRDLLEFPPVRLPDRRAFNFMVVDTDPSFLKKALHAYLDAFHADEDVVLHILADNVEEVQVNVLNILQEFGFDPEHIPDVSILNGPAKAQELASFMRAADVVLALPEAANDARRMGIPAFSAPHPKQLRNALAGFKQLNWKEPDVLIESKAAKRWLVSSPNWEDAMQAYLHSVPQDSDVALLIRTKPGEAIAFQERVLAWLTEHGYRPDAIPDVVLLDEPTDSEIGIYRQATAWIDTGDELGRTIAEALGLRIMSVDDVRPATIGA